MYTTEIFYIQYNNVLMVTRFQRQKQETTEFPQMTDDLLKTELNRTREQLFYTSKLVVL